MYDSVYPGSASKLVVLGQKLLWLPGMSTQSEVYATLNYIL